MDLPRAIAVLLIWLPTTHGAASDTIAGTTFAQTDFERQLNALSSRFLGRRYRLSPLGEGKGVDLDPLLRFDAFDCTTYIETVIALARSPEQNRDEQIRQLNLIRYSGGTPDFAARRHLPVFQWLPQLETAGILRDISVEIAPVQVRHIEAVISPAIWQARKRGIVPGLPAAAVPDIRIVLPYIPIHAFLQAATTLDETAVVSVIRAKSPGNPVLVSHQALLVPTEKGLRVRHARKKPAYRVMEESLARFLRRLMREKKRPVLGLNVADIVDPESSRD